MSELAEKPIKRSRTTYPALAGTVASDGTTWSEYRRSLVPEYRSVWRDIAVCYGAMASAYGIEWWLEGELGWPASLALVVPTAGWMGFWLHCLSLFGHESAHWGLAPSRQRNDQLADVFVWPWFGQSAKSYRQFHWEHHRHLGDPADTEVSYHNCFSAGFVARLGTGLALRRAARLQRQAPAVEKEGGRTVAPPITKATAARTAAVHLAVLGLPLARRRPMVAASWALGAAIVYPALNITRQLLEHRREDATCADDFRTTEHGAVTRWFGDGRFARWFGAAGFNRHLLHHWEPSVSCTNLPEMEQWLRAAGMGDEIERERRTYRDELRIQMRAARG